MTATISGMLAGDYDATKCQSLHGAYSLSQTVGQCFWGGFFRIENWWLYEYDSAVFCAAGGAYRWCGFTWQIGLTITIAVWVDDVRIRATIGQFVDPFHSCCRWIGHPNGPQYPFGSWAEAYPLVPIGGIALKSTDYADPVTCDDLDTGTSLTLDGDGGWNPACDFSGITLAVDLEP